MNQISALCKCLLSGKVISIKNAYFDYGISNIAREIGRSIERKFDVEVDRTHRVGKSRYGTAINWVDYKLNQTTRNQKGIKKMAEYIISQKGNSKKGKITKTK